MSERPLGLGIALGCKGKVGFYDIEMLGEVVGKRTACQAQRTQAKKAWAQEKAGRVMGKASFVMGTSWVTMRDRA